MNMPSKILFSSIFFFFAVFVFLSLIVSALSPTFSQLFLVFSYPHRAYDFASNLLLGCFVLMCLVFIIRSIRKKRGNTTEKMAAALIGSIMLSVLVVRLVYREIQLRDDDIIYALSDANVLLKKIVEIGTYSIIYTFFIFLPLLLPALKIRLNVFTKLGEWLSAYMPSVNTTLFLLFAYAIQPYYGKSNILLYIDLWLFYVGFGLMIIVIWRNRELFGLYEYANLLWLVLGVLIFSLCSKMISQADYNNTRTIFIIIGLMSWCGEWMSASLNGAIKPSGIRELFTTNTKGKL